MTVAYDKERDLNLTLSIFSGLDQTATDESIGFGDINIEPLPNCPTSNPPMLTDAYGYCHCTLTGTNLNPMGAPFVQPDITQVAGRTSWDEAPNYDANSKQCCHKDCTRCYGPSKAECIFTLESDCLPKDNPLGEPRACG